LFVTWRLHGSLPPRARLIAIRSGEEFVEWDLVLDRATDGPLWLRDARVAKLVADSFLYSQSELHRYDLRAWVVMANHVHLLFLPNAALSRITKALKNSTSLRANALLGRTGSPFWQRESFDHWIRNGDEYGRVVRYIENNPVKAGLVARPEDWRWSSAYRLPK
jgi:REP element-mobilizing transposase RayT